jgi:DNA mismatch endonuclease (patch repair protein)
MADVFDKAKRSAVMSQIRGHGNKATELALIKIFRAHGITGWRRRQPVFGKPDFVFPKNRLAVFVDGCFWHCCPKHGTIPKGNHEFWKRKLSANKRRDRIVNQTLRQSTWQVIRIWECELARRQFRCACKIKSLLTKAR